MQKSIGFIFAILFSFAMISCGENTVAQEPTVDTNIKTAPKAKADTEKVAEVATESVETIKEEVKEVEKPAKKSSRRTVEAPQEFKKEVENEVAQTAKSSRAETKAATPKSESKPKAKKKKKSNGPVIKFAETSHQFGLIEEGGQVNHKFFFENTGKGDLFIKEATATCGCTVPSYPKTPIRTGETSYIRISFNTKEKTGAQKPVVTVYTNARKEPFKLRLEGEVIAKIGGEEEEETPAEH